MNVRTVSTLLVRTDGTCERIEYHPGLFFGEGGGGIDNSMEMRGFFSEELGLNCDLLKKGVGVSNPVAEELFLRAHGRKWPVAGDCVFLFGRPILDEEEEILRKYLGRILAEVKEQESNRSQEESDFWEYIYDRDRANALTISPDGALAGIRLPAGDMEESVLRYFSAISDDAYPYKCEGGNQDELNRALEGNFRVRMIYDKMAAYMGGRLNSMGAWMTQDEFMSGDLIIMGEREDGTLRRLKQEELAVVIRLVDALIRERNDY